MYNYSGKSASDQKEDTAHFYARMCSKSLDDPEHKLYHVKVFEGFKKEEIGDEVRKVQFGEIDVTYDKYNDEDYIRKRLNVPKDSIKDKEFKADVAGVYLRRIDSANKLN